MTTAFDLENDHLRPINEIIKARLGKRISSASLWRWRLKGVNGVRLQCVKVGVSWCTTAKAFAEFIRAQTEAATPADDPPAERSESTTRRLEDAGLM